MVNLVQSASFELSYDEAYYWIYSNFLSWGYYDHPPMVAWMIKCGSFFGHSELLVRLMFNFLSFGTVFLAWGMSNKKDIKLFILLMLSLPLIQSSGFLALPDTGLLFFSSLFLYFTKMYLEKNSLKNIVALSLVIPLLFYSKYHGLAIVLFTTLAAPKLLKRKSFWIIVAATVILYMPHIYWQYKHDFLTFKFHLFGRKEKLIEFKNILNYITSQIALFGFFNFIVLIYLLKKIELKNVWERVLFSNVFGFLALLLIMSFRNQIEANWTISACMASVPLMMILAARSVKASKILYVTSILPIIIFISLRVIIGLPDSFLKNRDIGRLNEVKHWQERIQKIDDISGGKQLVSDTYQIASKLSFYKNEIIPALHLGSRDSHFSLLASELAKIKANEVIYFLTPKNLEGSIRVDTGYKDPVYVYKTTLDDLARRYGKTYEEVIRNRY